MNISRRELVKTLSAAAIGAASISVLESTTESAITSEIAWPKWPDFYEMVAFLLNKVAELQEKSRGTFNPHKDRFYIALPKHCYEEMFTTKNIYRWSVVDFCINCWSQVDISDTHDIQGVWNGKTWDGDAYFDERYGERTGVIIDCSTYCDPAHGEDSFVKFSV